MKREKREKAKAPLGAAGILARVILIVLLVYGAVTLYNLQSQIQAAQVQSAKEQETQLTAQVQDLEDRNSALRADIAAAGDQEKLEDVARDELGMVKSGEKVFYDTNY